MSVTGAFPVGAARFNVTPGITPLTVFVALLMGTPSTVRDAFKPAAAWWKLIAAPPDW